MNLLEAIYARKSIRHFKDDFIDERTITKIEDYIKNIVPLYCNLKIDFYITRTSNDSKGISGMYKIDSPHYILFYSEENSEANVNIGFISEQVSLFLTTIGIGSCYLGMAKPKKDNLKKNNLNYITMLAIGYPDQTLTRNLNDFKRKDIEEISNVSTPISEVVRLAPSGMNLQPWYIYQESKDFYHIYRTKTMFPSMNKIDIGIALSHIYVYAVQNNLKIEFIENEHKNISNMTYCISIKIKGD